MSNIVENDNGDVLRWDGKAWSPAEVVENDKGERRAFDGQAWVPVSTKGFKSLQPAAKGLGQRVVEGAATLGQGFFMGAGDEIGAGIAATIDPLVGKWPGKSWGERYDAGLANARGNLRDYASAHPVAAPALEIGGAVTSASALPAAGVAAAPTLLGRMGQASAAGAGWGGVSGFMGGEGGLGNRLASGAQGAAIGAVAAPVLTAGANGVAWAGRRLGMISDDPAERSAKLLGQALSRDSTTADDVLSNVHAMNKSGVPGQPVDAGGENLKALARAAGSVPGKGREAITSAVADRTSAVVGAADDTLLRAFNPEDFVTRRDKLVDTIRKNASDAYGAAFDAGKKLTPDKELNAILNTPAARRAWQEAYRLQKDFGNKIGVIDPESGAATQLSTEFLHSLKMHLDDMAGGAPRNNLTGKPSAEGAAFTGLAKRLADWIKTNNPAYKEAAAQYADDAGRIEALKLGSEQFFKLRPEELAAKVKEMGTAERELFLTGVYDGFLNKGYNVLRNRDHMASERFEERVKAVLPADMAKRMLDRIADLRKFQDTTRFVAPRTNSQTLGRALDIEDANNVAVDDLVNAGSQALRGNYLGAALNAVGSAATRATNKARGLDEETAAQIVKMLMSDPKASAQHWAGNSKALQTAADRVRQQQMLAQILATGVPAGGITATQGR